MAAAALSGGFADPARDASYAFRALMKVMARPGQIEQLAPVTAPAPLSPAAGTALLTLCDPETPIYLAGDADCELVRDWLRFHTGAPLVGPEDCSFAVGAWDALMPLSPYPLGTPEYPDRSATLIVEMSELEAEGTTLTGPGIQTTAALSLPDPEALSRNAARFPLGLDFFFTCGDRIAALPRSTRIGACMSR